MPCSQDTHGQWQHDLSAILQNFDKAGFAWCSLLPLAIEAYVNKYTGRHYRMTTR